MKNCPRCQSEDFVVEAIMFEGHPQYTLICTECKAITELNDDWSLEEECP